MAKTFQCSQAVAFQMSTIQQLFLTGTKPKQRKSNFEKLQAARQGFTENVVYVLYTGQWKYLQITVVLC